MRSIWSVNLIRQFDLSIWSLNVIWIIDYAYFSSTSVLYSNTSSTSAFSAKCNYVATGTKWDLYLCTAFVHQEDSTGTTAVLVRHSSRKLVITERCDLRFCILIQSRKGCVLRVPVVIKLAKNNTQLLSNTGTFGLSSPFAYIDISLLQ